MFKFFSRKLFEGFSIGVLLLEFVSIIIAIFLGNIASNWHYQSQQNREAQQALSQICEELSQNYENLLYYRNYYVRMLTIMDSLETIGQPDSLLTSKEFKNINPPWVRTFAFDMAKGSSKLANIEHEKAALIDLQYIHLRGIENTTTQMQSQLLNGDSIDLKSWRTAFNFYRQSTNLFYRDYELLENAQVCGTQN